MGAGHLAELKAAADALAEPRQFLDFEFASGDVVELGVFDATSFADTLADECRGARPVICLAARERTAEDLTRLSLPQVLALLVDEGQPLATIRAAQEVIKSRVRGAQ
jgi:hypothetical protein